MTEMKAKVKIISDKTKGMQFEETGDVWYNPIDAIKDMIITSELRGKTVAVTVDDKHKIKSIRVFKEETVTPNIVSKPIEEHIENVTPAQYKEQQMSKEEYWNRREARDIAKDKSYSKGASLNTAIEILKLSAEHGGLSSGGLEDGNTVGLNMAPMVLLDKAEKMANRIMEFTGK